MSRFTHRSLVKEFIDEENIPLKDWRNCLQELNAINTFLGGHRTTIKGLEQLLPITPNEITVAEIGCGGGDNLKAIYYWNKNRKHKIHYIGIDRNRACIDFAMMGCKDIPGIQFIQADYQTVQFNHNKPDIIFSSLFCHHFKEEQLVNMFSWLRRNSKTGFFINDLQRHPVAYYAIKILTQFFSRSYLVKNDAPISVWRGFTADELKNLLIAAGINNYSISPQWAFRYLAVVKNEQYTNI